MTFRFRTLRGSDGAPLSILGASVLLALFTTAVLAAIILRPLLFPARVAAAGPAMAALQPTPASFQEAMQGHIDQIEGRSLFVIPGPPSDRADRGPKPAT